jgi:predicted lipoprotein with Yx(FWY)xxD motif
MRNRWWAASGAAAAVALLAACGSSAATSGSGGSNSNSSPPAASSGGQTGSTTASTSASGIKTAKTGLGTVLVTSQGRTIYMFAIDKPNKSVCNSSDCVKFWPPLKGNPSAAPGANLPGKFGTTTRADGTTQATYDGHPLYLFKEDTAAGQTRGNALNENGGLWYALTPSGAKPSGTSTGGGSGGSGGSGGGGGGYGY